MECDALVVLMGYMDFAICAYVAHVQWEEYRDKIYLANSRVVTVGRLVRPYRFRANG